MKCQVYIKMPKSIRFITAVCFISDQATMAQEQKSLSNRTCLRGTVTGVLLFSGQFFGITAILPPGRLTTKHLTTTTSPHFRASVV